MKDPTRIDDVLSVVRDAWAGQPDLTLPTLMAMAANQGIGWGSSDDELMEFLHRTAWDYPPEISPENLHSGVLISTMDKGLRISLTDAHVIVRRTPSHQTVVWQYDIFRTTSPGFPLVITDTAGIDHRLGITERIIRINDKKKVADLTRLSRESIGDSVFVILTSNGETVTLSRRLEVTSTQRRSLDVTTHQWIKILSHDPFIVQLAGGDELNLGTPTQILLAET